MVIRAAQASARITADQVSNIESHGTGTKLGDPIEITSLCTVFDGRPASSPLMVGTVKTNIGHGESMAGIAGMLKAVLSLEKGRIPKHLHCEVRRFPLKMSRIVANSREFSPNFPRF